MTRASSIAHMADGQPSGHTDERGDSLTLKLDDPIVGAGKITYADFGPSKEKKTFEFMATRAKNGAVNKLFLQLVDSGGVSIVFNGIAERQQEK